MKIPGEREMSGNKRLFPYLNTGLVLLCGLMAAGCGSFGQVQPFE